ncbi:MAG: sialate O-acetylesterase, partial [Verrucomicrobia bacterium]|nr:sialate O-acetylesterase [Verrucomicrobiota bacterium]
MRKSLLFLFPAALTFSTTYGDVTLPPLISDNMLLQRAQAAVWGKADPGEAVTVKLGAKEAKTTAGKDGKWRVNLDGLEPGL